LLILELRKITGNVIIQSLVTQNLGGIMKMMLRFSSLTLIIFIFMITPMIVQAGCWVELTNDNFESGWGNYTDGGSYCSLYTYSSGTNYAHQGNSAANIWYKSGTGGMTSAFYYTTGIDVDTPGYNQIKVNFWFYAAGMGADNDFRVLYNDGTTWYQVAVFAYGTDFVNGAFYNKTAIIPESSYPFTTNMKIGFKCYGTSTSNNVYIDEIAVYGYDTLCPDENPPVPNPATFATAPVSVNPTTITMTATTGTDDTGPVEYYFAETSGNPGGSDSGWQSNPIYSDNGLNQGTQYTYTVQMRDSVGNAGIASSPQSATTLVTVPNIIGLDHTVAETEISNTGLLIGTVSSLYSNNFCLGNIIRQSPTEGTIVTIGSSVDFTVSLGTPRVDIEDLGEFVQYWLWQNCGTCGGADFSGDGDVDFKDFALFAADWMVEREIPVTLVINEFMAANNLTVADPQGEYDDWIEIYNYGADSIDMGGMYIADDSTFWQIPAGVSLNPCSYLLIWADDDVGDSPGLHANFKLSAGGDQVRLYRPDKKTLIDRRDFGAQTTDISYGRYPDSNDDWYSMSTPTPGASNIIGMAKEVWFSRLGGVFTSNFSLTLATASPMATIRYTTNGTIPTASSTLYSGPITINNSQTTRIRARAYETGLAPGLVASEVYMPLAADVQTFSSNLPIVVIDSFGYNIDAECNPSSYYPYRSVYGVFIDTNDCSRAKITDKADFTGKAGMRVRGDSSAAFFDKKQYSFETWDETNQDKNVSILGFPANSDWILSAPYDDKTLMRNVLAYKWSNDMGEYAVRTRFVELFLNDNGGQVCWNGGTGSATDYQGVYVLMEKIRIDKGRVDITKLQPTDNSEPEVSGGYIIKHDKNPLNDETFATTLVDYVGEFQYHEPGLNEITPQQKTWIKGYLDEFETVLGSSGFADPNNGYAKYIDVKSFIDFFWMVELTKQIDAYVFSTYMYKDRGGKLKMGPVWDFNFSSGNACSDWWWYPEAFDWYNCSYWDYLLFQDPEYDLRLVDRWHELREGVFSDENIITDIDYYYNLLNAGAVARNFTRWDILNMWILGNYYFGENYWWGDGLPHTYQMEIEWFKNWFTGQGTPAPGETYEPLYADRVGWIDTNIGYAFGYAFPPNFTVGGVAMNRGGHVSSGASLTMTGSTGTIYYTLNGTDPREPFTGNAVGTAYTTPITLNASVQVKARIKNGTAWSALNEATFAVGPVAENLRVTEIMYHPEDTGNPDDPNTEFIELKNIGTSAINLSLVKFTNGVDFTFPNMSLAAGQYVLVVKDQTAFVDKYGTGLNIAGEYSESLSNGGEEIHLKDAVGSKILEFTYSDGWYPITDGNDFTLNIINPANPDVNSWDEKESWQASNVKGGSPGAAYTSNIIANGAIVINEVLAHTDGPDGDWIELYNTTGSAINIGGWFISDSDGDFKKYEIAAGTTIPADGYVVFTEVANFNNTSNPGCHTKFALSKLGDQVYLSSGSGGQLSGGYSIKEEFGASSKNVSFGRYVKSAAANYDVDFTAMPSGPTKGTANSGPLVSDIVINEIMYHSANQYDKLAEYIELYNRGSSTAVLYDPSNPSNTWKFTNGIDFTFPTGITMAPGEYLLVVRCNPTIFRVVYSVPGGVQVLGPFENDTGLDNEGEKLELSMPGTPEPDGYIPYIRVEQVNYSDGSHPLGSDPWPTSADGKGSSLGRKVPGNYGNDVDNWQAVVPSPGVAN
jgi:hypothetical protein